MVLDDAVFLLFAPNLDLIGLKKWLEWRMTGMSEKQIEVVSSDPKAGSATIRLKEGIDYSVYTPFKQTIGELAGQGICHITYDLSEMTFIQSLVLGIIMWSYVEMNGQGGTVSIIGANQNIRRVFEIAQLDTLVVLK